MTHARRFAAYFSMSTLGAMLVGGSFFLYETVAGAAARGASKPVRRTASAPAITKATSEAPPSGAASLRPRARRGDDPPSSGRAGDAPKEGTQGAQGKATTDPGTAIKSKTSDGARQPDAAASASNPATPSSRSADVRPSAAKAPAEPPSIVKSTAEKFAAEPTSDVADGARASMDVTAPVRRDVAPSAVAAARSVAVTLEGPVFDGGDVPRAAVALDRMKASFVRCASTEAALTKNEGSIDLRFLVRAPGRAEGVDVDKARGVSGDVVRCMTSVLARSYVGPPSDDPVGVAITVRLRRPEAASN